MSQRKSTLFNTIIESSDRVETNIKTLIESIKSDVYKDKIISYRELLENNSPEANKLKIKLPAFKPSGLFDNTRDSSLIEYNQVIHLDYDKLTKKQLVTAKDVLRQFKFIYAFFVSPSGRGLKVFVITDAKEQNHTEAFFQVKEQVDEIVGIESDKSVKNIGRSCFISYDTDAYYNDSAEVFTIEHHKKNNKSDFSMTSECSNMNISIEEVWFRTEQQLKYSFSEGSRNDYVFDYGCSACRWGISEEEALQYALQYVQDNFPKSEIKTTVRSAYKKAGAEFGTINYQTDITPLHNFTTSHSSTEIENPRIPNEVFETLPESLREACSLFDGREREVFLTGAITAISGVIQDLYCVYHHDETFPNLYCFIAAPSSSGKGAMSKVYHFLKEVKIPINRSFKDLLPFDDNNMPKINLKEPDNQNIESKVWIPANTSGAMLKLILEANNGGGIISSTENKTLEQVLKKDYGAFGDDLLKGFENEPIGYARKGDGNPEYIHIDEPKFSVMVSGVIQDLRWLINSQSSGLTSRFMILSFNDRNKFQGARAHRGKGNTKKKLVELSEVLADRLNRYHKPIEFDCTDYDYDRWEYIFKKLDEEAGDNEEVQNLIWRLGKMVYKIAMVFTAVRGNYDDSASKVICHTIDWNNALKLVVEIYYEHAKAEVLNFKSNKSWIKGQNIVEYLIKKEVLNNTFTTAYIIEVAKEAKINVNPRSIYNHINKAIENGMITRLSEGKYKLL